MEEIDLVKVKEALVAKLAIVKKRLQGNENVSNTGLSDTERTTVQTFNTRYETWSTVLAEVISGITRLIGLGWPELPKQEITQKMLESLNREYEELIEVRALYYTLPKAARFELSVTNIEEQKKEVSRDIDDD